MTSTQQHGSRRRARRDRSIAVAAVAAAAFAVSAPGANAEVKQTAQAAAAHATWLAYAPAPSKPATVCVVDSGVDLNADTTPVVLRRFALDGGTVDDVDPDGHHGTLMAMMAAAAVNDTGMVGAAPSSVRIISIRSANPPANGQPTSSPFDTYALAVRMCTKYVGDNTLVVDLALGTSAPPTDEEQSELADQVQRAHDFGLSVVAAAGNTGGAVIQPAATPSIFAVAAADAGGVFCSFASRGPGLDLLAPGCGLDTVDPVTLQPRSTQGSSQASAFTAGVLASLRAYAPNLSWSDAEQLLASNSPNGVLNVEAAFRAAGLGSVVDAGVAATPPSPPPASATPARTTSTATTPVGAVAHARRWAAPRIRSARYRHGVVSIAVGGQPGSAVLVVTLQREVHGRWRSYKSVRTSDDRARLRSAKRPGRVSVVFFDPSPMERGSSVRYVSSLKR